MSLSALFILSLRGDTIIIRDFKHELKKGINEVFFQKVHFYEEENVAPPIFNLDGINYIYIKRFELYFVLVTLENVSPNYYLEILERLIKIIKDQCGVISEEAIRKNFTLVYEIIDEMIDFGLPQLCSTEQIKPFVFTEPIAMVKSANVFQDMFVKKVKSNEYTKKPISNQPKKIKNEIFVDIIEKLTVLYNPAGKMINSGIDGCVKMKSFLQNNPEIKMVLNDDISIGNKNGYSSPSVIDDFNFHKNVHSNDFESLKTAYFTPPDGEFILMNYRINSEFTPPFRFVTIVEESNYKLTLRIKLQANFSDKFFAGNVSIKYNMPKKTGSVHFEMDKKIKMGQKADYLSKEYVCVWTIPKVQGGSEFILDTKITLETNTPKECRIELGPIAISFDMPNFNVSKMQIKELAILSNDKKYNASKWIRVVTQANSFIARIA